MSAIDRAVERLGDGTVMLLAGLLVGIAFGALGQQSRFCLRSAVISFSRGSLGHPVAIWALAFSSALAATQAAIWLGMLDVTGARQLAAAGSLSGAILGGLLFGVGMILARGCASRLLILSATGNMRALMTGLVLTVVAQASLRGVLAPAREYLAGLWVLEGGYARSLLTVVSLSSGGGLLIGLSCLAAGVAVARHSHLSRGMALAAASVGLVVAAGWVVTYWLSLTTFETTRLSSVTFTGPSADTLMGLINARSIPLQFDTGLVPGVFIGSGLAALVAGELRLQGFEGGASMVRYLTGAVLMGFGGMLAGGCAVGAGMSGGAIFAVTSWVALAAMWLGAGLADAATDRRTEATTSLPSSTMNAAR